MGKKRGKNPTTSVEKGLADNIPSIIIMGETGVGKSTFIDVAGGKIPVEAIGHRLGSCTTSVHEYIIADPEQGKVRLIDTPGFNNSEGLGDDVLAKRLLDWLKERPGTRLTCVLLLYDITRPRATVCHAMSDPSKIPNSIIVTTKWSESTSKVVEVDREKSLEKLFNPDSDSCFTTKRFDKTYISAWVIVGDALSKESKSLMGDLHKYLKSIRPRRKLKDRFVRWFAHLFN